MCQNICQIEFEIEFQNIMPGWGSLEIKQFVYLWVAIPNRKNQSVMVWNQAPSQIPAIPSDGAQKNMGQMSGKTTARKDLLRFIVDTMGENYYSMFELLWWPPKLTLEFYTSISKILYFPPWSHGQQTSGGATFVKGLASREQPGGWLPVQLPNLTLCGTRELVIWLFS